ncbi:uncharacterized protein LOC135145970 [Zophobas morio]|uniref:uncharacterized protein LOC135145970 n=1 Tax=Zophobas morio TaxID=2755281 RepID=UPI0030834327
MKYLVEHLDSEEVGEWTICEYEHICEVVGKHRAIFTNISSKIRKLLPETLNLESKSANLLITDPKRACLLDSKADKGLEPKDAELYDYIVCCGILGDDPPRDRTSSLRNFNFERRHLGDKQMTTDTAILCAKLILEEGRRLEDMQFVDGPEIATGEREEILLFLSD